MGGGDQRIAQGQVIAIDGKQLRGSQDGESGKDAIYMVSVWATENELVLGQRKVYDKSKEITAIPKLLRLLEIAGCIVTINAIGFITSLESNAEKILEVKRSHWGIENRLHWVLDNAFNEDHSRVREDHAPRNFAVLRHMALNLLKQEHTVKAVIKAKRLKCGWDVDYLLTVLGDKMLLPWVEPGAGDRTRNRKF